MPPTGPTASTRVFLLLGNPVTHSLSPVFQNAAIAAAGLDAVYGVLRCDSQSVAPLIRALCRAGGGGNVTVPHKADAALCLERPSADVQRTGACNTFWGADGVIHGANTDTAGFRHAALRLVPSLEGVRAVIAGAGGAAAAAACTLIDDGAASVTLINRSPDRARLLAARLDRDGNRIKVVTTKRELVGAHADLVINATSLGREPGEPLPLVLDDFGAVGAALDMTYNASGSTPWVSAARRLGIPAEDGREMLIGQGAHAFALWFRTDPPLDAMRAALLA
jgi:shikimate dehydrogenase